jgi:hydroxymethylglutaryl-CoA lyase
MGGLGGCPFAQDELVGNVPTEEVLRALHARGLTLPVEDQVAKVAALNAEISREFSGDKANQDSDMKGAGVGL